MAVEHPAPRRPRWSVQTHLFQIGRPAFWVFMVLLLFGFLFTLSAQLHFYAFTPSGLALSWGLMLAFAIPMFLLIYLLDLFEREPISLVIGALLWGAVAATTLSGIGNTGWGLAIAGLVSPETASRWVPALTAPWVEEIFKVVGVVFIYLIARREIDGVMDGFVYGAMVGLGFTLVEDVFFFIAAFGGTVEGVLTGFYARVVASGLYGHVLYTGLAGMGVAYFVTRRGVVAGGRRWGIAGGLFLVAMLAHFVWNSPLLDFFPEFPWRGLDWLQVLGAAAVKGVPLLVFAALMVLLARRREHRWLETVLESEAGRPGLTPEELEALRSPAARRRTRREARARGGRAAARATRRLHRDQMNLAVVVTRARERDHPDVLRQHEHCARLRAWRDSLA